MEYHCYLAMIRPYDSLFPLTVAVITKGQAMRVEQRPTGVNDDTVNDDTGVHVDVNRVHDETLGNTEVKVRKNAANDIQTHTNKQSDRSNKLTVGGEARRNESRR